MRVFPHFWLRKQRRQSTRLRVIQCVHRALKPCRAKRSSGLDVHGSLVLLSPSNAHRIRITKLSASHQQLCEMFSESLQESCNRAISGSYTGPDQSYRIQPGLQVDQKRIYGEGNAVFGVALQWATYGETALCDGRHWRLRVALLFKVCGNGLGEHKNRL